MYNLTFILMLVPFVAAQFIAPQNRNTLRENVASAVINHDPRVNPHHVLLVDERITIQPPKLTANPAHIHTQGNVQTRR